MRKLENQSEIIKFKMPVYPTLISIRNRQMFLYLVKLTETFFFMILEWRKIHI